MLNADPTLLSMAGNGAAAGVESATEVSLNPGGGASMDTQACDQPRREVAFVDGGVDDYQQLIDDLRSRQDGQDRLEIVVLAPGLDGVDQISAHLQQQQRIDAVHVFSHGSPGAVTLGNARLSADTVDGYAPAIEGWRQALSADADLLLYGCDLASGDAGQALMETLAGLTGADVAASDDVTGDLRLGGDWNLEHHNGEIETEVAFSSGAEPRWTGVLATFTVNTTADTIDDNINDGVARDASGKTSLRAAIMQANYAPDPDTILLGAETYTLTLGPAGDYDALYGDLDIHTDITIIGADMTGTVIDMDGIDRVFHLQEDIADLTLTDLTIQGGNTGDKGGGVFVAQYEAKFTASRVLITGNIAKDGGGIFNEGTTTLTDVVISNNGDASTDEGGGIYNEETAVLTRVTISGNHADFGGGIHNDSAASSLTLTNVTISGNTAVDMGGGMHTQALVTILNSAFTSNTANEGGGIYKDGSDDLFLTDVTLSGNTAVDTGGGLFHKDGTAHLNRVTISGNQAIRGGGIHNESNDDLFLTDVTVSGNTAGDTGGGLYHKDGTAHLNSVTISGNQAVNRGGGIHNESNDDLFLTNVTVSGNIAGDTGGGMHTQDDVSILNSTFTSNTAHGSGGGIAVTAHTANIQNTIVAGNQADVSNPDVSGIFNSLGHNLIGDDNGGSGFIGSDITGESAQLDPLADNGGFTLTHALQSGSSAIDPAGLSGAPTFDQRGTARDATPDIGAFEFTTGNTPPTVTSTAVTSATEDVAYTYTFTTSDADGDTLTLSAPTLPSWLSFDPGTGILSGTPANGDVGDHSVVLRVNDGTVDVDQSFTITVANTNDPPTITSTAVTDATEDAAYSYTFTAGDVDVGDTLTLSAPTLPTWLSFDPGTGILSGTPANGDVGDHSVVLRVNDGTVDVDQSFTITVANTNDPPTITSTAVTNATEDAAYSYTFTAGDVDVGDTLTLSAPTLPSWLSFDPATGILSGTPANGDVGDHSVVLRVNDGTVDVDQGFTITVINTNTPPTITSTAVTSATEDAAYSYTFTAGDVDVGDTLTLSAPTLPSWLSFDPGTGILSGTPANGDVGDHSVVLRVNDGTVDVDQGFTITVINTNTPPTITSTAVTSATEDAAYSYTFTAGDVDVGDTLTLSAPTLPTWLSFDPGTGILSGTPANGDVGDHSVVLRVNDGTVDVDQSFTITVANTNDPPTITSTAVTNATEDAAYSYTFTAGDVDVGDTLTLSAPTLPSWLSFDPATGILSGTPANGDVGDHSVVLRVNDGTVDVDQGFTITVINTNTPPTITSTAVTSATEDAAYSYTFTAGDVDVGDTLTLSAPTLPSWLSFDPATGILSGTPANGDVGDHSVVLRVNDGTVDVDQGFTITVINTNTPPTITSTAVTSATEDAAYSYTFTAGDVDVGDTLTLSAPTLPSWLSFDPGTGILSGTPANGDVGDHSVVLRVNDGTVDVDQSFTITVINTNTPPTITSTAVTNATEDAAYSYTFTAGDVDMGDTLTLSAPTLQSWLSFDPGTGILSGTPTNSDVGDHSVVLRVNDGTVDVDQSFTITVINTNTPPTITSTAVTSATEDSAYSYTFTAGDVDVGDTLTLSAPTLPIWLSFDPATGILSGTPANGDVGDHSVILRVNDGTVDVDQSFTITVANTNTPPTITSTAVTNATEDAAYSYTFTAGDVDVGDTLTLSAPTLPSWLSFDPGTGILSGTPANGDVGDHSVVLRVNDGTVDVDQSFTITVINTNTPPTITSTAVTSATEDSAYSYTFTAGDVDVGDTLTLSAPTLPSWLSFDPGTGILSGTPANGDVGDHSVVLRVNDGTVDVDQSFTITVANINNPPIAAGDSLTAIEDNSITITPVTDLLGNDTDIDGDSLSLSVIDQPARGSLVVNDDGTLTYTPEDDFHGVDAFTYTISDNNGGTATGMAIIVVAPVGDTPRIVNGPSHDGSRSDLIFIFPNEKDGPEVTHFRISDITHGTLYLADGTTRISDGEFITVAQGQEGLIFVPDPDSTSNGGFKAESSENGTSVALQSHAATTTVPFSAPRPRESSTEQELPRSENRQGRRETVIHEQTQVLDDVADETDAPAKAAEKMNVIEDARVAVANHAKANNARDDESSGNSAASDIKKAALESGGKPAIDPAGMDRDEDASGGRGSFSYAKVQKMLPRAQQPGQPGSNFKMQVIRPLTPEEYEFVRKALDAFKNEIGNEIRLSRTLLGSAMATTVGLSAGYVIWLLKGGSLLASVLSSIPAWQLTDPMAILAGRKRADNDDGESLENIIDDGSGRKTDEKDEEKKDETGTHDETTKHHPAAD